MSITNLWFLRSFFAVHYMHKKRTAARSGSCFPSAADPLGVRSRSHPDNLLTIVVGAGLPLSTPAKTKTTGPDLSVFLKKGANVQTPILP